MLMNRSKKLLRHIWLFKTHSNILHLWNLGKKLKCGLSLQNLSSLFYLWLHLKIVWFIKLWFWNRFIFILSNYQAKKTSNRTHMTSKDIIILFHTTWDFSYPSISLVFGGHIYFDMNVGNRKILKFIDLFLPFISIYAVSTRRYFVSSPFLLSALFMGTKISGFSVLKAANHKWLS